MHISEGVLAAPVLIVGAAAAVGGLAIGLKKMDYDEVPQVALLSAAFFVASLVHVPIGGSSVHLVLNGLIGLMLGWSAFPAIFVGLTLQALLFQFGGISTLGVNTVIMALPAIICYYLFRKPATGDTPYISLIASFAAGFSGILFGALLIALALISTGEAFFEAAWMIVAAHFPVMVIEGLFTVFLVGFLRKVKPELLEGHYEASLAYKQEPKKE